MAEKVRRLQINVIGNEEIETPFGGVTISVDAEKLSQRLERKLPQDRDREQVTVSLGKVPLRERLVDKTMQELIEEGKSERAIRVLRPIFDLTYRGATFLQRDFGGQTLATAFFQETQADIEIDTPQLARRVSSLDALHRGIARLWQHEEDHLVSPKKGNQEITKVGQRRLLATVGSGVVMAGIGVLAGANAHPEIASPAITTALAVEGFITGMIGGKLLGTRLIYDRAPAEQKARRAAEEIDPEVLSIFGIKRI